MTTSKDDELQLTVDTLIDLGEPEALLATLQRAADRQKGPRWRALATVLAKAEDHLMIVLNAKPAGPDDRPAASDEPPDAA